MYLSANGQDLVCGRLQCTCELTGQDLVCGRLQCTSGLTGQDLVCGRCVLVSQQDKT